MAGDVPSTSSAPLSQEVAASGPLVEVELDRRAVALDVLQTRTCPGCGRARGSERVELVAPGRFRSLPLRVCVCAACRGRLDAAWERVRRVRRISGWVYSAQMMALMASLATGGGGLVVSGLALLLVSTWGVESTVRRKALRGQPRLLEVKPTSVRLRMPEPFARVLQDERPRVLLSPPAP